MGPLEHDNIYLQGHPLAGSGKIRMVEGGLGWKDSSTGAVTTIKADTIQRCQWMKVARDYQLRLTLDSGATLKFDGFSRDSFEHLREFLRDNYRVVLEPRETGLRGWNCGRVQIVPGHVEFSVLGKTVFELPLDRISNAVVSAKNELTIEMSPSETPETQDAVVDIRFCLPPDADEEGDKALELCNQLRPAIEAGISETIASFEEVAFLVPRGRYKVDISPRFLRLRGKSYDYKIPYANIVKVFLLPKPDDQHVFVVLVPDPPLRQGQTRYSALVSQFVRDNEVQVDLTLDEEQKSRLASKLETSYTGPEFEIFCNILKIVSGHRVVVPGSFQSFHADKCVKCSTKAHEGYLYCLDKSLVFVPKPGLLIPHETIDEITFSRVDESSMNSRTFDMRCALRDGSGHAFSNINKEEFPAIEGFLREKSIRFRNELVSVKRAKYVESDDDLSEISSAEEESADEEFVEEDESGSETAGSSGLEESE